MAADTVDAGYEASTEEATRQFDNLNYGGIIGQAVFFGVCGLIHAAVGLAGGTGGFLTKRSGLSEPVRNSVCGA